MTKPEALDLLMLLSAIESWGMSNGQHALPKPLAERLNVAVTILRDEVLEAKP